jgi:hypothetical protein
MRIVASLLLFTSGCFGLLRSNNPAPLRDEPEVDERTIRTAGQLQLAFAMRFVGSNDGGPMMTMWIRNAGPAKVPLDLTRLRIVGYGAGGARPLELFDPRGEIEPLHVEPGVLARERIRLADPRRTLGELTRVCVEVASIVNAPVERVCFVPAAGSTWVVAS